MWKHKICDILNSEKKEEIENFLKSNGYNEFEHEVYDFFEQIYCEDISAYFQFEFNRLKSIEFNPVYNNEGDFIWSVK